MDHSAMQVQKIANTQNYLKLIEPLNPWRESETVNINSKWRLPILHKYIYTKHQCK